MGTHTRWDRFSGGPYNNKNSANTNKYNYTYVQVFTEKIKTALTDELNWILAEI